MSIIQVWNDEWQLWELVVINLSIAYDFAYTDIGSNPMVKREDLAYV